MSRPKNRDVFIITFVHVCSRLTQIDYEVEIIVFPARTCESNEIEVCYQAFRKGLNSDQIFFHSFVLYINIPKGTNIRRMHVI